MGTGRPRSIACALVALALMAVAAPAAPATASPKGKHRHVFRFGTRPLTKGAKGKDVRYLQRALSRLGVATSIDGVFGKGTFRSVEAFEQQHGWPVNGVISKKDAKRIKKLLATRRVTGGYFVEGYVQSDAQPELPQGRQRKGQGARTRPAISCETITVELRRRRVQGGGLERHAVLRHRPGDGTYQIEAGRSRDSESLGHRRADPAVRDAPSPVPGPRPAHLRRP